jgi:hypothetical protein
MSVAPIAAPRLGSNFAGPPRGVERLRRVAADAVEAWVKGASETLVAAKGALRGIEDAA